MKRLVVAAAALLVVICGIEYAEATGWGVGGFGGVTIPIAQDDAENGTMYGAQVRLSLGGLLGIEPNFALFQNGDWEHEDVPGVTFEGSSFYTLGVNVIIGSAGPPTGIRPFLLGGVKYFNEDNNFRDFSESKLGWNGGLGIEIGASSFGVEARAVGVLMPLDDGGSRKWVQIRGGLNYYFGAR